MYSQLLHHASYYAHHRQFEEAYRCLRTILHGKMCGELEQLSVLNQLGTLLLHCHHSEAAANTLITWIVSQEADRATHHRRTTANIALNSNQRSK